MCFYLSSCACIAILYVVAPLVFHVVGLYDKGGLNTCVYCHRQTPRASATTPTRDHNTDIDSVVPAISATRRLQCRLDFAVPPAVVFWEEMPLLRWAKRRGALGFLHAQARPVVVVLCSEMAHQCRIHAVSRIFPRQTITCPMAYAAALNRR